MQAQPTLNAMELDKLRDKIKDIRIAMLTTQEPDGNFHTRPMATHEMDPDGTMWFFTYDNSHKVDEVRQNNHVSVAFSDPGNEVYVVTTGLAEVVRDKAKIDELWSDLLKTWFPNGKDDPHVALMKVTTHAGEYWDRPGGTMVKLFEMAKGAITGDSDKSGRNEKFGEKP
ncbi:pyridoxamine 5'-phosphate oxidase family protein [Spirosoma taeanense]|uniref:Pyridoxamine 5'-phosphate oxidase family protein n=1 Tax=Spirosoma taeanense TaxID=2735870 RepID=A0A6M5YAM0_9BACT|nr:pyridoxamine 5'-phosphate oxidase family protein [Spirosoma taeanense]QJW90406.1 pyridoxamine 5'-phosphate oxidase family protein [Spirosoma taeanense]